jgi:hypothetical protein
MRKGRIMQSTRWIPRLLAVVLPLLLTTPAAAADRAWRTLEAPHYQVHSQLTDRETKAWTAEFDQFIASISDLLRIDAAALPPLTVLLFQRDRDFTPYKLSRPDGSTANVAGQFVRHPTWSLIGLPKDANSEQLRRTIFHEATHWLMSANEGRHPAWFSEGIAELLSTFDQQGNQISWARPIQHHLSTLDQLGIAPLREFLTTPAAVFNRDDHTDRFYAQSWAFTHFLLFSGDAARAELLGRFLETFESHSGEYAVDAVFGAQLPALERDFQAYISRGAYTYKAQPARPLAEQASLQPASPARVESALGFLAVGANRSDLARQHADKAIELDASAPGGHEVLAYLALQARSREDIARHAEAALRTGSKDSQMYLLMGDLITTAPGASQADSARQRADLFKKAISLSPRRLAPYQQLAQAVLNMRDSSEEDAGFLANGLRAFPGDDWIRAGAAAADYRSGRRAQAMEAMQRALRPDSTLDARQRPFVDQIRRGWLYDTMNEEIRAAVGQRDLVAARAAYNKYRGDIGGDPQADSLLQQVDASLSRMEQMRDGGN